jgi:hypothetical protein
VHSFAPRVSTPIDKSLSCLSFQVEARVVIFIPGEASAWTYAHGLYLLSLAFSVSRAEPSFEVVFETSDGLKAVQAREKLQPAVILLNIGLPVLNGIQAGGWMDPPGCAFRQNSVRDHGTDPDIVEAAWGLGAPRVCSEVRCRAGVGISYPIGCSG